MKKTLPAGAGEKMQYIVHAFNDNTIRFLLHYPGSLRADLLKQAVFSLVSRIDVLHASFAAGRMNARWHIHTVCPDDCFTLLAVEDDPLEAGLEQALHPLSPSGAVQLCCILVQGAQSCVLVLLISHLCADGSDGKSLLQKLCEAYNLLFETGSCDRLDLKNGSRAVEQVYACLSRRERLKLLRDPRTNIRCVFPFPTAGVGRPVLLRRQIHASRMEKAHQKAKHMGATVNDLLLTACYYAYAETTGADWNSPVSILSMMDLRRHCEGGDSQGLCNLSGALSTALPEGVGSSFDETLRLIAEQTRISKNDPLAGLYGMPLLHSAAKGLPMALLLAVSKRLYGSMSLGMTNVGTIDCSTLQLGGLLPTEGWFGVPVKRKPGVQISIASFGGACSLGIWGYASDGDRPVLQQLQDGIADHVESFSKTES